MILSNSLDSKNYLIEQLQRKGFVIKEDDNNYRLTGEYWRIYFNCLEIDRWNNKYNYNIMVNLTINSAPRIFNGNDVYRRFKKFDLINGDYDLLARKINECKAIGSKNYLVEQAKENNKLEAQEEVNLKLKGLSKKERYSDTRYIETPYFRIEFNPTQEGIIIDIEDIKIKTIEQALELYNKIKE
jgi:hypothetical protein